MLYVSGAAKSCSSSSCSVPEYLKIPLTACDLRRNYDKWSLRLSRKHTTSIPWKEKKDRGTSKDKISRTPYQIRTSRSQLGRTERSRSVRRARIRRSVSRTQGGDHPRWIAHNSQRKHWIISSGAGKQEPVRNHT